MITSREVREKFINFFKDRGHAIVPSSSLLSDDPSVLLTTAGMQQFKRYYTGELDALKDFGSQRTASIQKCFRTSDIDEVGDKTHLTFFEMLGNFSFGDYFKKDAILWAYKFLTEILEIDAERISVTILKGDKYTPRDEEAYRIWYKEVGIPQNRILDGSREDNFWGPTGNEGPCGPTTEIYVDGIEVWNLVFNEYYQMPRKADEAPELKPLAQKGIDTGMGFERIVSVLQGVDNVFETDSLHKIMVKIFELAPGLEERAARIFTDHLRASQFLAAEGLTPSNKGAGYVLRRLLRRLIAYQIKYDLHADFFPEISSLIAEEYGEFYPELKDVKKILEILENERSLFSKAIGKGLKALEGEKEISAKKAFYLYETFGLPFELIKELGPTKATGKLTRADFEKEFKKHQEISRAGAEKKFGGHGLLLDTGELKAANEEELKKVVRLHTTTHLLHWALRKVLGNKVRQMGSDINAKRTRFDFSFDRKLTPEEIKEVEITVNREVERDLPVYFKEMPKEEAEKTGALHFFKQKYPDVVKVYFIGSEPSGGVVSKEFCGGPHVERTGEIGVVKIIKEEAVAAGVRRIRAVVN